MRPNTDVVFNAVAANATTNSSAIPATQKSTVSLQSVSTSSINGTLKLQASNEESSPTNWVDIPSSTLTINSATTQMTGVLNLCYVWIRVVFTDASSGMSTGNITANLHSFGV